MPDVPDVAVLEVPPGARWTDVAASSSGDHLVVVGPAGVTTVVGPLPDEVADTVVTSADGTAAVGTADALAAVARGELDPVVDDDGVVFHRLSWHDGASLVVAGVLIDAERGTRPAVALAASPDDEHRLRHELADTGTRDLGRLLRYDDAADPAFDLREVAPDVLVGSFWTPAFCATVIRAAEAVGVFTPAEDDPVPGHEVSLAAISPRLYAHLEDDLLVRVIPLVQHWWPLVEYHGMRDAFVIKYGRFGQTELRPHHDVAQLSASVKLNDGYTGGDLTFPRQGWSTGSATVGDLVVWPSLVTHPHHTEPITAGVKYGLTIWMELPQGYRRA